MEFDSSRRTMVLPHPALVLDGAAEGATLSLTTVLTALQPGCDAEEAGILTCGVGGLPPAWELAARHTLGAECAGADGSVLCIHSVDFVIPALSGPGEPLLRSGDVCEDDSWHAPVRRTTREVRLGSRELAAEWAAAIRDWAYPRPRKIHVVVNPFSGSGYGLSVWRDTVEPILKLTPHVVVEYLTAGPGDASRYCKSLELADDGGDSAVVAAVGGDGSMSEVINGLMAREDARRGHFTICFVPAGSANAMAHMTGCGDALTAAWALAKCRTQRLDLFACHQGSWQPDGAFEPLGGMAPMYGFLSVTGALVADIDIDSEVCRCIGPSRFTAYALSKVFCCLPPCSACAPIHARVQYRYRLRWLTTSSPLGQETSRAALAQSQPARSPTCSPHTSDWQEWKGHLQIFHVLNAPGISREARYSPSTRLDSGFMGLQWMDPSSRCGLLTQFDMMDKGEQLETPGWRHEDVVAVCVDELEPASKVVVDGEAAVPGASWQAEVLPQFVHVVIGSGPMKAFSETLPQNAAVVP